MHSNRLARRARGAVSSALVAATLALVCAGCRTTVTGGSSPSQEAWEGPWLKPSPLLAQQIEDEAARLPWTHGIEHLEQIRWFAAVGEPAYPTLLALAGDERPHVAAASLAALGATHDKRLVPHVQEVEVHTGLDVGGELALERARTLVRLGDWGEIPNLIEGLASEHQHIRALCDQTLFEATRQRFDYDPRAGEEARIASIRRWEEWWLGRTGEGLLISGR